MIINVTRAYLCAAHKKHAESLINRMEHEYSCLDTQHVTPEAINQIHVLFFVFSCNRNRSLFIIMLFVIFNIHTREIKRLQTDLPQFTSVKWPLHVPFANGLLEGPFVKGFSCYLPTNGVPFPKCPSRAQISRLKLVPSLSSSDLFGAWVCTIMIHYYSLIFKFINDSEPESAQ